MEAYKQSVQQAGDALEDKLNELAHDGNVTAAIFLLKGLRPNKYRERSQVDVKYPKRSTTCPKTLLDDFISGRDSPNTSETIPSSNVPMPSYAMAASLRGLRSAMAGF